MTTQVHPSAVIEEGADLGADTVVWAQTQIRRGASIGDACVIGRNVFIDAGVVVGARCKVQNNALLYHPARIGDGVFIGPGVVLTNDRFPRAVNPTGPSSRARTGIGRRDDRGRSIGRRGSDRARRRDDRTVGTRRSELHRDPGRPPFALVAGSPARRVGWVGRPAVRSTPVDGPTWACPVTAQEYVERDDSLTEADGTCTHRQADDRGRGACRGRPSAAHLAPSRRARRSPRSRPSSPNWSAVGTVLPSTPGRPRFTWRCSHSGSAPVTR